MLRLSHGISPSTQGRVLMPSPETYPPRDSFREQQPPVDPHPVDGNDTLDSRHLPCQSCIQFQKIAIRPKHQPLPLHLRLDQWPEVLRPISPVLTRVFSTLCVIAYGQRNMEAVWDLAVEDGQLWVESTDRIARRVEATGVTNGLLLAVSAALFTTTPPLGPVMNYTLRASYILQLTSFGLTLGSIVVGSALLYTIPMCTGEWYRETLAATRARICCTLVIVSYPFLSAGLASSVGSIGLLMAGWNSEDGVIRIGCVFLLLAPVSTAFLFICTQRSVKKRTEQVNRQSLGDYQAIPGGGQA